ncbi:MAG TPA: efflux RND transporter periplasmic adaptor subunit [Gemmatimonadales bacterium]|jgi:cobalt-zinc-cadmium efflux system membrane fusion protein|nr:efflux RND transporter periplasmic adaptor subunit [Gemmatimonadales bacterium]
MMPKTITRTACVAVAAVLIGCNHQAPPPSTARTANDSSVSVTSAQRGQIQTVTVARHSFSPTVVTTGTVNFDGDRSTAVIAPISGPVIRLLVNLGDTVVPGQAMAIVSSPDFANAVAGYRKAESAWRNAQRIETLDEKLFANDALARADLDQAKSDLASAAADREAATQQMYALGVDSASVSAIREGRSVPGAESAIRAPIAGNVVERLITPGELLQAGTTQAFTVADLSTVWVMGNVFESDIASVHVGAPVMVTLESSADSFPGRIDYVGAEVDPDSKATAVRIVVPNRGQMLRNNMLVQVEIRGGRPRTGITIPVSAVLRDDDNLPFVYLAAGANQFNRRRIVLGGRSGDVYEVTDGLAVGDAVVMQGALYLEEAATQ